MKNIILCAALIQFYACQATKIVSAPVTVNHKAAVLSDLAKIHEMDSEDLLDDAPFSNSSSNASVPTHEKVMSSIVSQLKGKRITERSSKKKVIEGKRTKNAKILDKLRGSVGFQIASRVIRPFKPRYCSRLIYLKALRRKLITNCIIDYYQLGFLARMRVRLASTTNLLLNSRYDGCTNSRMIKSLEAKIDTAKSCLDSVKGIHTIVSPVGVLIDDN